MEGDVNLQLSTHAPVRQLGNEYLHTQTEQFKIINFFVLQVVKLFQINILPGPKTPPRLTWTYHWWGGLSRRARRPQA